MRKISQRLLAVAALCSAFSAAPVQAGVVLVSGDSFDLNTINNFYNTFGGHTSNISDINAGNLAGVDLLWAVQPADDYSPDELNAMSNFLADGGRIAFMGEHGAITPDENQRINTALSFLGSDISIFFDVISDPRLRTASVGDGQILPHPITNGVNAYEYAAFAPLAVSGSAQALMLGEDNPNEIMMAFQNVGPGSIFLITDQNVWDGANALWPNHDNEIMFDNLVDGRIVVVDVSEPMSLGILGFGLAAVGCALRRRNGRSIAI